MRATEIKVGLFALVALVVVGLMNVKLSKNPSVIGASNKLYFLVDDASGLIANTSVKVAGVKVGIIKSITLENGRARIEILLQSGLNLTEGVRAEIVSNGILGDKYVSLIAGDPLAEPLENGSEIKNVVTAGNLNNVMSEVSKVATALQDVALALKQATVEGSDDTPIGRIVVNIERMTEDLAQITHANKDKVNHVIDGLAELTDTLKIALGEEGRQEFKQAWGNVTNGMGRLDRSLAHIEEVTTKIADGEGTIGRLVNDEETVNGINKAIFNLNRVLGGALNLRTTFDYHSEFMTERSDIQSFVGLKIQPGLDRYYYLGIVQDPLGVTEKTYTETTTTTTPPIPPSEEVTTVDRKKTDKDAIKFTALFAKNFYNFTLKGGLIQSSGGFGIDYHFYRERLSLSMEMFDFADPNLRLFATWRPIRGFYLIGGGDSILQRDSRDFNPFVGGGLTVTNDDINIFAAQFFR